MNKINFYLLNLKLTNRTPMKGIRDVISFPMQAVKVPSAEEKTAKEIKDQKIEEKSFSGIKLTVTCTNFLYAGASALTSSGRIEFFHDGKVKKFYIVRIGTKTQQQKYESFNRFYETNKSSWRTQSVELFNPNVTLEHFEKFIKLIETQKGSNLEKGYCFLTNNCAATISQTIRYFFADKYAQKSYWVIKNGFSVFYYAKALTYAYALPVEDGIRIAILLSGGPYLLGYLAPGFMPIQAPPFFNSLNDVLIEAETYAIWYGKPLIDMRGAIALLETIARNRLAISVVSKAIIEMLSSPLNAKDLVSAGFANKLVCDGFHDFLKSQGYSTNEVTAMEPAFLCVVALYFLLSGSPTSGLLFLGLGLPKKTVVAGIICIIAGMAYTYNGFNSLLHTQLGLAFAVPMYHCVVKPIANTVCYPLVKAIDHETKELVTCVTPCTDLLADTIGSAVKRVGATTLGSTMYGAASRVVNAVGGTVSSLSRNSFFARVCSPVSPVASSMRKLVSATCQITGNTYTGAAFAAMVSSAQSRFWNKINFKNSASTERSLINAPTP